MEMVLMLVMNDSVVQQSPSILSLIRILCWSEENNSTLATNEVFSIIQLNMSGSLQQDPQRQVYCCSALRGLAFKNNNISIKSHEVWMFNLLKNAMIIHQHHAGVQEQASGALRNLSSNETPK